MNNERIALAILCVSIAGFIATLKLAETDFLWGMLNSACGAAMVGGLADWFAIKALFEKVPLDSHSDILVRKRKELTEAIVDFATKDLLNVENVQEEIDKTKFSGLLIKYLNDKRHRGREKLRRTVQTAAKSILGQMDFRAIVKKLEPDIRRNLEEGAIEKIIPKVGKIVADSQHMQDFFKTIIGLGKNLYNQPEFQKLLEEHIEELGKKYDQKGFGRETARAFAFNNDEIRKQLNDWVNGKLDEIFADSRYVYDDLSLKVKDFLQSENFMDWMIEQKEELLANDDMMSWIYEKVDSYQRENRPEMLQMVDKLVNWGLDEFIANKEWQKKVDTFLKEQVNSLVSENHDSLGDMIRGELGKQSDKEIVGMVKEAAGDDIHAIRISGSCVGALAGLVLYVVGFVLENIWR